jgi:hypothetical protein
MTAGVVVAVVSGVGLVGQGVRGAHTVTTQHQASTVRTAGLDDAFFSCIDTQARSLVSSNQGVILDANNLGDFVTLLQGVGSWATIAGPGSSLVARLSLRNNVSGPGTCLGTVVVAHYARPQDGVSVRIGSGASVPGHGPPPPTPF